VIRSYAVSDARSKKQYIQTLNANRSPQRIGSSSGVRGASVFPAPSQAASEPATGFLCIVDTLDFTVFGIIGTPSSLSRARDLLGRGRVSNSSAIEEASRLCCPMHLGSGDVQAQEPAQDIRDAASLPQKVSIRPRAMAVAAGPGFRKVGGTAPPLSGYDTAAGGFHKNSRLKYPSRTLWARTARGRLGASDVSDQACAWRWPKICYDWLPQFVRASLWFVGDLL
jgi:hypothetical protein